MWVFFNPDTGEEISKEHPVRSGECPDAINIREATDCEVRLFEAVATLSVGRSPCDPDNKCLLGQHLAKHIEFWSERSETDRAKLQEAERRLVSARERPKEILAWAVETFGPVAADGDERTFRFIEEALELAQARGIQRTDIDAIAGRVYQRQPGAVPREVGQCQLTLEALAEQAGCDASHEAKVEFDRIREIPKETWAKRHAAKTAVGITKDRAQ